MWRRSTPPWPIRPSTSRPTGLSTRAVTTAVSRPKQRLRPRATLYSPPPSQTSKRRAAWMRPSPGSRRSITSPRHTRSKRQPAFGRIAPSLTAAPRPSAALREQQHEHADASGQGAGVARGLPLTGRMLEALLPADVLGKGRRLGQAVGAVDEAEQAGRDQ